jgi:hypothetical protein
MPTQTNKVNFHEEKITFQSEQIKSKGVFDTDLPDAQREPEILGVTVRLGNRPIVYNLKELLDLAGTKPSPEFELQFKNNDVYTITHAIGVIRTQGKAKVKELQYNAEITTEGDIRTIDLLPNTKFKKVFEVNSELHGAFEGKGKFSAEIPEELTKALSGKNIDLGGNLNLELSTNANFIGKINFSIQLPMVQAIGIATNKCTWVLNPDANPLLGDQLMIQTVAVPKGLSEISYRIKGLIKVDKNIFSHTQEKETSTQTISINLI